MKIIEFMGDGRAGKSTQVKLLANYLKEKGLRVITVSDREILNNIEVPFEKAYEFNINQFTQLRNFIEKRQDQDIIIVDRGFTDAEVWFTMKHQMNEMTDEQRKKGLEFTDKLRGKYFDIGFLILVEPEISLKRHQETKERDAGDEIWFTIEFLSALHDTYLKLSPKFKEDKNMFIIDGKKPVEETFNFIKQKIDKIILSHQ